jgi:hypothetical protein
MSAAADCQSPAFKTSYAKLLEQKSPPVTALNLKEDPLIVLTYPSLPF